MVATQRTSEPSLRRAAILLSNLDAENRRRLLAHLPPPDASRLRAAAAALSDVDPLEIRRTLAAFVGRVSAAQQQISTASESPSSGSDFLGDSRRGSAAASDSSRANPNGAESPEADRAAQASSGLQFLNDVPDTTLLRAVGSEHPQTIAVVLASIEPQQAARLLRQLAQPQRDEAIRRLSRLEEVPQDSIDDIGRHLRGVIGTVDHVGSGEGRRLLTSIFSALGAADRQSLGARLSDGDGGIAAALAEAEQADAGPAGSERTAEAHPQQPRSTQLHSSQVASAGASLGASEADRPGEFTGRAIAASTTPLQGGDDPPHSLPQILPLHSHQSRGEVGQGDPTAALPESEHADKVLASLPPGRLREVLAELAAREALLALCGLPPRTVRRLLRTMPRRSAKEVRQRLDSLGPLDLSEVDRAKQKAAAVALGGTESIALRSLRRAA